MNEKMDFFIGPCVLESEALAMKVAETLQQNLAHLNSQIELSFKGSFDKANRTSIDSYRGPGMEEGLRIMQKINKELGMKTITDFHLPEQAMAVAEVVDTLQVPAFLCRQTDMIVQGAKACLKYNRQLKIKKGQFLSPEETHNIVDKALNFLPREQILLTERGSSFGYNNLVVDMASYSIMKSAGVRVIHDATHCVQRPGGLGKQSGGKREFIEVLARAAVAAGADGVFMEAHPDPENALSDKATSLPLGEVKKIVEQLVSLKELVGQW